MGLPGQAVIAQHSTTLSGGCQEWTKVAVKLQQCWAQEGQQHLARAAVPVPEGMEAVQPQAQLRQGSESPRAGTRPAELWRTTINLSARDAGLFFCTLSTSGIYCICLWKGCLEHLCQTLSKFTSLSKAAPEPCRCCRFVFTVTQGDTPRQNQTKSHFKAARVSPSLQFTAATAHKSLNYHQIFFLMSGTIVMISIRQK